MTQDQVIILLFKIVLVAAEVSILAWVAEYTRLAPWWRDQLGRTIVSKSMLLALALIPTILSMFFTFSRFGSHVAAWCDIGLFGLITPVMLWRIVVWRKISHEGDIPGR